MQTQDIASRLPLEILSDLTDVVIVTDLEQHVLYWNGPAEQLYGLEAQQSLGHRLETCCPELGAHAPSPELLTCQRRWRGEIVLHRPDQTEVHLECSVRLLQDRKNEDMAVLWVQRDQTPYHKLQAELQRWQQAARQEISLSNEVGPGMTSTSGFQDDSKQGGSGSAEDVVLWAEDDDNDATLMARAWQKARVNTRLIRVQDGADVIRYLQGEGKYQDRREYPLPTLLLLDIKMPGTSGLDVVHWLHTQPGLREVPVVILTSSAAKDDIHEAARFGVKGYLVKPVDVTEWVLKVQTVTAQCR